MAKDINHREVEKVFLKVRSGRHLNPQEIASFKSSMLVELAVMDHEKGWAQQYHVGALRNNNSRRLEELGIELPAGLFEKRVLGIAITNGSSPREVLS